ncbi:MAG TPA: type II secretion system protein [Gemmatimonadales bacterium]|nr:type II secretion system protein [Gemmatimonadales bacterium]
MSRSSFRSRGGFTLIELLIVMVILGVVGAAFVRALTSASKVSQAQAEKSSMQSNLRAGGGLLPAELREITIDASSTDLIAISKDSVRYRAMRRLGLVCAATEDVNQITVRNTNSFGLSGFAVGDSVLLYVENDDESTADDIWFVSAITANPASGTCPDAKPGTVLTLQDNVPAGVMLDAPMRTFELMTLRVYQSDGRWWLGAHKNEDAIQPVLGPLSDADSTFGFRDANGNVTATKSSVRVIEATLHGETANAISKSGYDARQLNQDSLKIRVRLRNAP